MVIVKVPTQLQGADVYTKILNSTKHGFQMRLLRGLMTPADIKLFDDTEKMFSDFPSKDISSLTLEEEEARLFTMLLSETV